MAATPLLSSLAVVVLLPGRPSPLELIKAQQRVGEALDAASEATLQPAYLQSDVQPATGEQPTQRRQGQTPTKSFRRDMLTRPAARRPRWPLADEVDRRMDDELQPVLQQEHSNKLEAEGGELPSVRDSGPERAALYMERKYKELFGPIE